MVSVASEGYSIPENPTVLIESWVDLKIRRDIRTGRPVPWQIDDIDVFVEEIIEVMENVALEMSDIVDNKIELRDDISEKQLSSILVKSQEYFLARRWRLEQPDSKIPQEVSYWITSLEAN